MNNQILLETKLLQKFAEFTRLAMSEIAQLRDKVGYYNIKQANEDHSKQRYHQSLMKVANALYNSDLDFVTGDFDRNKFLKQAMEDPSYLARTLEKVCNAADVSLIGKPARVAATKKAAYYDPVYAKAFGFTQGYDFLTEEE